MARGRQSPLRQILTKGEKSLSVVRRLTKVVVEDAGCRMPRARETSVAVPFVFRIRHLSFFHAFLFNIGSMRDVVITGVGIVSPIGVGRDDVWTAVIERRSGVRLLPELAM